MLIFINNRLAALKQGTSFDFISENRLFTGSDSYTLTITFPIRGCSQNLAIFGHINRKDVDREKIVFDCEIRDRQFSRFGTITITEISDTEVKTQFLEGRSEQNFDETFDNTFINELALGSPPTTSPSSITPSQAWFVTNATEVALPWVSTSGNVQNDAVYANNTYTWSTNIIGLSWQPYLLLIAKRICDAVGYTYDFSVWEESDLKYILICNTMPYAWDLPNYARALPHWTVDEFFAKLELFLNCEFDINHKSKHVSFAFSADVLSNIDPVVIDNVVDSYTTEVSQDEKSADYLEAKNLVFAECDHAMWKYYSCDWFLKPRKSSALVYETLAELIEANRHLACSRSFSRGSNANKVLYAADCDTYFLIRCIRTEEAGTSLGGRIRYNCICVLQPINLFGGRIIDESDDADQEEIEFVPAWIDYTDEEKGRLLFLTFSGYDEEYDADNDNGRPGGSLTSRDTDENKLPQPFTVQALEAGERDKVSEYYSKIFVAYWDGAMSTAQNGKLPHPYLDSTEINEDWTYFHPHFSMRINSKYSSRIATYTIEPKEKFNFSFLTDGTIPNPRALFYIRGKKYICEKITATFTENGMSQLLKGVFYRVTD